ncbi:MAG: SDR family oxidoreductase [Acidobacteria bacterium]|nr:MAG: SDR family oxidoreductase [Acidobacteriota bacterium]
MRLSDKRAVITGGGRGIGAATARLLAAEGASVVVAARSAGQLEELVEELRSAGHEAFAVPCDVTDPQQVEHLREATIEHLGGADVLVNNAGIATSAKLEDLSLETWNHVFAVNVTGVFLCTRAFLPGMRKRRWGRVVNVASVAGKQGAAYISAYAASKHAVVGFTRALAVEVAAAGVTVNAVCPGYVDTDMTVESVSRIAGKTGLAPEEVRKRLAGFSPQGRIYSAEEVAYQVLCLCDPRAGGVNGQSLVIDGGTVQS